ncbi:hypothetical protein GBA65_21790 (plasmid) [Rubrobacter marinus]|uniref:Uncharacterized protein n=1 Tax=Rubrobacter marinus TaxID=2653852 RepID=A0A6G8Q3M8_9ACTN|nr:hypothetical protein [Rubrobacter marinus]QIN81072.1 hypothetical protein GBA65_21790 [Rubrobacter marinus]
MVELEGLEGKVGALEAVVALNVREDSAVLLDELGVAARNAAGVGQLEVLEEVRRRFFRLVEGVGPVAGVVVGPYGDLQEAPDEGELPLLGVPSLFSTILSSTSSSGRDSVLRSYSFPATKPCSGRPWCSGSSRGP